MMNGVRGGGHRPKLVHPVLLAHELVELPLELVQSILVVVFILRRLVDRTFSAYAPMDSGPPQAIENRGGGPPDVYGLPYSVTRHTAGHGRWLDSCCAGSLGVAVPRPYSTRICPLLRLPSRALTVRPIAPSAARR
ncbi:hypothetical protein TIFTF001_034682 [Ficus carica]|uniref:Uncharacterized protein n=1 Tax=Ficus carica TaxID=3494 RepID=A0AA88E0V1_FICCA|nr:hypothetical protein TIFTF001_034682 [Ficus carica]